MPKIDPSASLDSLLRSGSNAYVAWMIQQGWGRDRILDQLRSTYPQAGTQTLIAAYNRGDQSWEAGATLTAAGNGGKVLAGQIPGGPAGRLGFEYTVEVTIQEPTLGATSTRVFPIYSATNLTLGQLKEQVLDAALARYAAPGTGRPGYDPLPGFLITSYDVYSVQRA